MTNQVAKNLHCQLAIIFQLSSFLQLNYKYNISVMRTLSPVRSASPLHRPKINFHYPSTPLRERNPNLQPPSPTSMHKLSPTPSKNVQSGQPVSNDPCRKCRKPSIYRQLNAPCDKYCSPCAIQLMKKGTQMSRIQLKQQPFYRKFHQKQEKENCCPRYSQQSLQSSCQNAVSQEVIPLRTEISQLKNDFQGAINKLCDRQLTAQGVKEIYREKKLGLKNHYEKIKAAIKISIEKDLAELEKRQARSMQCLEQIKSDLQKDFSIISQINSDIQCRIYLDQNSTQKTKLTISHLTSKRKMINHLVSQLQTHNNQPSNDSLQVRLTIQQMGQVSQQLYNSDKYTMLSTKQSQTLFSFEKNHP